MDRMKTKRTYRSKLLPQLRVVGVVGKSVEVVKVVFDTEKGHTSRRRRLVCLIGVEFRDDLLAAGRYRRQMKLGRN